MLFYLLTCFCLTSAYVIPCVEISPNICRSSSIYPVIYDESIELIYPICPSTGKPCDKISIDLFMVECTSINCSVYIQGINIDFYNFVISAPNIIIIAEKHLNIELCDLMASKRGNLQGKSPGYDGCETVIGASYGGKGGSNNNSCLPNSIYGNFTWPISHGSAYSTSLGGGFIYLQGKTGKIGDVYTNGDSSASGGSVIIKIKHILQSFVEVPFLYANGGNGLGCNGGGGGGRIAIYTDLDENPIYTRVNGGSSSCVSGEAGTVYKHCFTQCKNNGTQKVNCSCNCTEGWESDDCSTCSDTMHCNDHGSCINPSPLCKCDFGWGTTPCNVCDPTFLCSSNGICDSDGTCTCNPNWFGNKCDIFCNSSVNCTSNGICNFNGLCNCDLNHFLYNCSKYCDNSTCSSSGTCDLNGDCICYDDFFLNDCSIYCKSSSTCNGNGQCNVIGDCVCDQIHKGINCSELIISPTSTVPIEHPKRSPIRSTNTGFIVVTILLSVFVVVLVSGSVYWVRCRQPKNKDEVKLGDYNKYNSDDGSGD